MKIQSCIVSRKFGMLLLFCLLANTAVFAQNKPTTATRSTYIDSSQNFKTLTYVVTDVAKNTYGYDIYANGKLFIHQSTIPGVAGNTGFKTKKQADDVAKLVISKIRAGEMPPSVDKEELKKLKAL